ncbi:MAG: hypothetical protein IJ491_00135 [Clostridia bacterium]|nr:hypothetical protein [Clostridia bacterium]
MAKQGMKRPDETPEKKKKNDTSVPEIQGKAKNKNEKANPIIAGTRSPDVMVYHTNPTIQSKKEKPISDAYDEIDTDLARDNLQNDIPEADLQDLN